jgi:hypothetical protein
MMIKRLTLSIILFFISSAHAQDMTPQFNQGDAYENVKKSLITNGWKPIQNTKISRSSLYAQELYEQGMTEVVDCISMELDGCWFYFTKENHALEIKTITRQLSFEKLSIRKFR